MRMSENVEWSAHCCVTLAWLGDDPVPVGVLARFFDLPRAYLNKSLQAMVRHGLMRSVSGPRGGFRLALPPGRITLMDIVTAHEGREEAFRCTEIRQRGEGIDPSLPEFRTPCAISAAMRKAELAWRRDLATQTVADLIAAAPPAAAERARERYRLLRG
jgi:Rrf2 family protein